MNDIKVGDTVEMKKPHPCGSRLMKVLRTGLDYRLECLGCGRVIMSPRRLIDRHIKKVAVTAPEEKKTDD